MKETKYILLKNENGEIDDDFYEKLKNIIKYSTQKSILSCKSIVMKGNGFNIYEWNKDFIECLNVVIKADLNYDINCLLDCVCDDYSFFNGFALKIVWESDKKIESILPISFDDIRVSKSLDSYYIRKKGEISTFSENIKKFNENDKNGECLLYFHQSVNTYPEIEWIKTIPLILEEIYYKKAYWNVLNMEKHPIIPVKNEKEFDIKIKEVKEIYCNISKANLSENKHFFEANYMPEDIFSETNLMIYQQTIINKFQKNIVEVFLNLFEHLKIKETNIKINTL